MERRIRIVWALSLISAALAIGVQCYWLYNQYKYVIDTYAEDTAARILAACEQEYELRKAADKRPLSIMMQRNTAITDSAATASGHAATIFSFSMKMPIDSPGISLPHLSDSAGRELAADVGRRIMNFSITSPHSMSDDELQRNIRRAVTESFVPFGPALLDSILTADMPSLKYTTEAWTQADSSLSYISHWEKTGGLLRPELAVSYAYSPMEHKGVLIRVAIPPHPIFGRMAFQLAIALGLVLLLTGCLMFQIKTILKQKKLGELRENFVNTMIHELKRPVQTLKTFIAFLGDREMRSDENATRQVVHDSMFEIDNLSVYLNKLKDIIRTDSETTPLQLSRFNLRELVEKLVRLRPLAAAGKEVRIDIDIAPEAEMIEADPVHLANMLSNLIENSLKYSGREVRIAVKAESRGKEICISVTDNGIGIPVAEQKKVFDKFYRASNLPDSKLPGLGLGLSYVKLITEAHRGRLVLSGRPGEGTVMQLIFPQ
ncbi:MAG: HAMP domain-containing histidine kinase [Tannerellaceae bacterium]|jgi:two-component system phosphate regulon sensor histidine kinase PhoR|nr:HAMP domain-containing histidine kinase [Tannerellaceae bacterium]